MRNNINLIIRLENKNDYREVENLTREAFMALELSKGSLKGIRGTFHLPPVFEVSQEELKDFEKSFPYKEKHVTDTQLK
jgi:predicted N-acetyltransferase YhbS